MEIKDKLKAFNKLKEKFNKDFGDGSVDYGSNISLPSFYSTGLISLDTALGGGICKGRVISIYGEYSSGKTTLILQTIAYNQKIDDKFMALYLDQESSLDLKYCKALGIDLNRFIVINSCPAEEGLEIIRESINEGIFNMVVIDSTSSLAPQITLTKEVSANGSIGVEAKLLSVFIKQIVGSCNKFGTSLICVEQVRDKIGGVVMVGMPTPVVIGCGKAVGFYCSQRIQLKRGKDDPNTGTTEIKYKVVKNKLFTPNHSGVLEITYGEGFNSVKDEENLILEVGVIKRVNNVKWSYTTDKGEEIEIKGKDNIISTLKEKGLLEEVKEKAKKMVNEIFLNTTETEENEDYNISKSEMLGENIDIKL